MTGMRLLLAPLLALTAGVAVAQEATPPSGEGMLPRWEVEEIAGKMVEHAQTVQKILNEVRPKEWVQDGAPAAYVDQHAAMLSDLHNLDLSAQALGREPEKLTYVVDTFLWLDRLHSMLSSITSGVRRYQSPSLADLLDSSVSRNIGSMEQLKGYMRQLAVSAESEMEVANAEAQRCRSELVARPPAQ